MRCTSYYKGDVIIFIVSIVIMFTIFNESFFNWIVMYQ
ncbi:DUF2651 family protein [Oceanobacillus senegalensis]